MNHETLLTAYENALASHSWEVVAPLVHEDACFAFSDGTYFGKAAIGSAVTANFDQIKDEHYAIKNVVWTYVSDRSAICIYDFAWSGLIAGKRGTGGGRGTTVVVREGERWLIIHEHLGPAPA
ncbi:nuclear transport factor 2 family protein [Paraburkholderia acidicola]|uniref:Nuclear transport factor 2 family protein n=1 Tax=Paraburkholderia acidicola TaxID=1912599 RepID=A0ABV1LRG4_9BURK